jgi:hypothetical protein
VRTFPRDANSADEYVDADEVEAFILRLHERYPAPVVADVRFRAGGRL